MGFGELVPTIPLKMVLDKIQIMPHGRYRLTQFEADSSSRFNHIDNQADLAKSKNAMINYHRRPVWMLSAEVKENWQMLYAFDVAPQNQVDLQVGNWFVSTHPNSPFRNRLIASRIERNGVRHTLLNNRYRRHQVRLPSQSQDIHSVDELLKLSKDQFYLNTDSLTLKQYETLEAFLENSA